MSNIIKGKEAKHNHRLASDIRKRQASILDNEILKKLNPSRGVSTNWTTFSAGKKWAEKGYTLDELTHLYNDYNSLIERNLSDEEYHCFLEQSIEQLEGIIDFTIQYPTQEKSSDSLKRLFDKLQKVVDFPINNPTAEQIRISRFIDGYNSFNRKAEIDFDLGYQMAQNGVNWDNIPIENRETRFFKIGFYTYFTEIGFDYGLLGTDLEYIPSELQNNPFFMDGYNNGLIELLFKKSSHNSRGGK